jgi:hypothetical protein
VRLVAARAEDRSRTPSRRRYRGKTSLQNRWLALPIADRRDNGKSVRETLAIANDTEFGLGSDLWTLDINRA